MRSTRWFSMTSAVVLRCATTRDMATTTGCIRTSCRERFQLRPAPTPITAYNNGTRRENLFNQTDFVWIKAIGEMQHTFLGGVEIGRQDTVNHRNTGFYSVGPNTNSAAPS